MDKNIIKKHLSETFLKEAATPGIDQAKKMKTAEEKVNNAANKESTKNMAAYDKDTKSKAKETKEVAQNKFNASDEEKTYHDDMEILNGQEMIKYDRKPTKEFTERATKAIEGNAGAKDTGNIESTWGASSDDFGKDLVKRIKKSEKDREKNTPSFYQFGTDIEVKNGPKGKSRSLAVENKTFGKVITEGILADKNYTHFALNKKTGKIIEAWNYKGLDKEELQLGKNEYFFNDLRDLDLPLQKTDYKIVTRPALDKMGLDPQNIESWDDLKVAGRNTPAAEPQPMQENKKPQTNPNTMKRLKFKRPFNGVGNALKLIPESYRTDKKEFEMTDSNETYRIRWEGNLSEGRAVILTAANKTMVNEDISRMKALFNYKSEDTLGIVKGNARLDEGNKIFNDILGKTRKLLVENEEDENEEDETLEESENIEGQKPEKTGPWEEAGQTVAPEVPAVHKKKLQTKDGTAPAAPTKDADDAVSVAAEVPAVHKKKLQTKDGTAPAPKVGPWEEASVNEGENIQGVKASKTAPFEKAGTPVAPEVPAVHKKKLQTKDGTAPAAPTKEEADVPVAPEVPGVHKKKLQTKDGTAPAPKADNLGDAGITQAADAKKHVHMHEGLEDDGEDGVEDEADNYYSAGADDSSTDDDAEPTPDAMGGEETPSPVAAMGGDDDDEEEEDPIDSMLNQAPPAPATPAKLYRSISNPNRLVVAMGKEKYDVPPQFHELAQSDPAAAFQKVKSLRA